MGRTHTDFDYRVTLIEGNYQLVNGELTLDTNTELKVVRDFTELSNQVGRKVGVSSIEYDAVGQRLLLLTSYEGAGEVGAFVWVLPDKADGSIGNTPHLVRDAAGAPFLLTHKAEGMAVLSPGRIFVIHDDDRIATRIQVTGPGKHADHLRQLNEAAFDIVQLDFGTATHNACPALQQ